MDIQKAQKILTDTFSKAEAQQGESFLEFSVNNELFAVPLLIVKEVLPLQELTPIPRTANYIKGMMNLRGQVITVADLATKLSIDKKTSISKNNVIMIIQKEDIQMGVIVDSVHQVLHLQDSDISQSNGSSTEINMNFIRGVHQKKNHQESILIIDLEEALGITQLL